MRYDPALPIAVFLGPSLDAATASAILPANYYPPVRMGDVYRLMTCGVRVIVIIDGVFHKHTPVWQREIVAAIRHGITVVGASSMGALRAVELEPFGMIGLGTIVDWYRSGRIDGDDEVALQHADAEFGYRPLSEPLVNVRWNLERAAAAGVIGPADADALIAGMQTRDHSSRSYQTLFQSRAFEALSAEARAGLRDFLAASSENLKAADARAALQWCADRMTALLKNGPADPVACRDRVDAVLHRGVPSTDGRLTSIQDLLPVAIADRERVAHIVLHGARRFYLVDFARQAGVTGPDGLVDAYERRWIADNGVTDRGAWLTANAMTEAELRRALETRALAEWLIERGPAAIGLDRPILEAWAHAQGIDRPAGVESGEAFRAWLVESTPAHFGFDQWSPDLELIAELQLAGEIARMAARVAVPSSLTEAADAGAGAI